MKGVRKLQCRQQTSTVTLLPSRCQRGTISLALLAHLPKPGAKPSATRMLHQMSSLVWLIDLPLVTVATSTDRDISDAALSSIAKLVPRVLAEVNWQDSHTDTAFENLTDAIYGIIKTFTHISRPDADNLVDIDQFKENVAKKSALGFVNLLRKALKENNQEFWHPIVTHDVFYTVIPESSNPTSSKTQVLQLPHE
ncbi:hypothetical protein EDB89DRAFT_1374975 [Lactarius sanguifluus]|nr:hypothetical protein EDB89DRAFT_1374975 [Lactarius sanguifluus]